ncbi:hypothetical protein [Paraburkholderia sp. SOS3]|uniref:hypothetical protein n=1 Tax=Paraburkholderia sp. SOS3 TaxID=1926494 RepID=UPI0009475FE5|nr:hypothetical protein [Paraburkholderia sp. SOS3]APR34340.1 hypothetical protein BTO02_01770 [Paraburkholderia sp. SOS3]
MTDATLEQFDRAMRGIYDAALRLNPPYRANLFLRMVNEHGGKEAANRLLATRNPSEGFTQLFLRGLENLCLSVEYLVLQKPWRDLFTAEQLAVARKRLIDVQCPLPADDQA